VGDRRILVLLTVLAAFVAGIGWAAFAITADLDPPGPGGLFALMGMAVGAGLLMAVFLVLMHRRRRRDGGD